MTSRLAFCLFAFLLAGCASAPLDTAPAAAIDAWQPVLLPGKPATRYSREDKEGRKAIAAVSEQSASLWRRQAAIAPERVGAVHFSWWVQDLVPGGNVADIDREDAPARVIFGFAGDLSRLNLRTRMMYDLAEALTGEKPPYATLMYVWDATAPVGSVIVNPRSDRIRKIVVDSGPGELRRWRDHRRDLAADFRLAFDEAPGALTSIAVMTDSDNTRSQATSWYGSVELD
ncbi:conserved exported hypothetical protein [Rubrivivax sp. A210]|uniref:DUF3047 domain-containing protein n=1 Tax=Rubrivivax sp. A210 TaxID=2772301 RepID=UPI0019181D95|nr:DUF3047 domain-containing protein [Rubrivivax sp. A210]CAD5372580.1 conserved exported hypothetical protein [Rubrivivax sp. A210]